MIEASSFDGAAGLLNQAAYRVTSAVVFIVRIRAPLVAQVAWSHSKRPSASVAIATVRHAGERFQVFAPLAHRVSLATMAEVKKNFCDDRIAVRQLVSII